MDEIDQAILDGASQIGAEAISEFTIEQRSQYLIELRTALNNLNAQYKAGGNIKSRRSIAEEQFMTKQQEQYEQLRQKLQGVMKNEEHFQDDDVIIDPKRGTYISKNISEELQKIIRDQEKENLKAVRDNVYALKDNANLTKATFEAMSVVLRLRSQIMQEQNMEEEIGVTYEFNGEYYLIRVPMQAFLNNDKIIAAMNVSYKDISESRISDPYQINFSTSVLEQMKKMQGAKIDLLNNVTQSRYEQLTTQSIQKIRETKKYLVASKPFTAQTGFVMEGLVEEFILGKDYTYAQDNIPWFGKADIYDREKGVNISLKNMIEGSPTMVRLNSVHKVLEDLIKILETNTGDLTSIQNKLKNQIYNKTPRGAGKKIIYQVVQGTAIAGIIDKY